MSKAQGSFRPFAMMAHVITTFLPCALILSPNTPGMPVQKITQEVLIKQVVPRRCPPAHMGQIPQIVCDVRLSVRERDLP